MTNNSCIFLEVRTILFGVLWSYVAFSSSFISPITSKTYPDHIIMSTSLWQIAALPIQEHIISMNQSSKHPYTSRICSSLVLDWCTLGMTPCSIVQAKRCTVILCFMHLNLFAYISNSRHLYYFILSLTNSFKQILCTISKDSTISYVSHY